MSPYSWKLDAESCPDSQRSGLEGLLVVCVVRETSRWVASLETGSLEGLRSSGISELLFEEIERWVAGLNWAKGQHPLCVIMETAPIPHRGPSPALRRSSSRQAPGADRVGLSPRETEVIRLFAKGFSFDEAARLLSVSPQTITAHAKKVYQKLAVHSRSEAVYEAERLGLL